MLKKEFGSRVGRAAGPGLSLTLTQHLPKLGQSFNDKSIMAAAYFFSPPIDVEVKLEGEELRKKADMKLEKEKTVSCPVYYDGESVSGQVRTYFRCGIETAILKTGAGRGARTGRQENRA